MKKGNKELAAEILAAIYAKDKLEEIERLVEKTDGEVIEKADILRILEENETDGLTAE